MQQYVRGAPCSAGREKGVLSAAADHVLQVGSKGAGGSELQTLCGSPGGARQARRGRRSSDLPPPRSRRLTEGPGNACPAGVLVPRVSGMSQLIPWAGALGDPCLAPCWPRDPVPREDRSRSHSQLDTMCCPHCAHDFPEFYSSRVHIPASMVPQASVVFSPITPDLSVQGPTARVALEKAGQ